MTLDCVDVPTEACHQKGIVTESGCRIDDCLIRSTDGSGNWLFVRQASIPGTQIDSMESNRHPPFPGMFVPELGTVLEENDPELAGGNTFTFHTGGSQSAGKRIRLTLPVLAAALNSDLDWKGWHGLPTILAHMARISVILSIVFICLIAGCSAPERPAMINHVVFFKLEDPEDSAELIEDCDRDLSTIPGVASYYCGQHGDFGRQNVDSDYDVGFYVGFETEEAYRAYLVDPAHTAVVGKWKPRWEWIRIYDVVDTSP